MKKLLFAGVAVTSLFAINPAMAASDSLVPAVENGPATALAGVFDGRKRGGHGPMPGVHHPRPQHPGVHGPGMGGKHRWGHRIGGRWFAGFYAPGGWGGYQMPYRGFVLPSYWVQPSYRIVNYPTYGLYAPQAGYGWTRYYDDAVLSDGRGYVQDYRRNIPWDRYEGGYAPGDYPEPQYGPAIGADRNVYYGNEQVATGPAYPQPQPQVVYQQGTGQQNYPQTGYQQAPYSQTSYDQSGYQYGPSGYPAGPGYQSRYGFERYERCLKDRGVAGGVIGAVVGAVIGNRVAGRGDRLGGSLIGGGLGALAGVGIEKATNKCRKYLPRGDEYYYGGSGYPGGVSYPPAPPPQYYPQQQGYPYPSGQHQGWYYPPPVVTTVTVTPAVTTTTTVTEEVYYETVRTPAKKKIVKKWRPKPKPRCVCR